MIDTHVLFAFVGELTFLFDHNLGYLGVVYQICVWYACLGVTRFLASNRTGRCTDTGISLLYLYYLLPFRNYLSSVQFCIRYGCFFRLIPCGPPVVY
jgi:hypothetical protein